MKHKVLSAWHAFLRLIYPDLCDGCGKTLLQQEEILCLSCKAALPYTHYHTITGNETSLRFAGRIPFSYATSWAYYIKGGLLQYLLEELKYKGRQSIGSFLGREFATELNGTEWIREIDLVICVPLHPGKYRKRGYNQCTLIAGAIAETIGKPFSEQCFVRVKDTGTQTSKTRQQRAESMRDAFVLTDPERISGSHVLLIDDVLTTGATLEACVLALEKADVTISIATIGIAMN